MSANRTRIVPLHFKTVVQASVPQGRNGKHQLIVATILKDLDGLKEGSALTVPLAELAEKMENIRAAMNRATRKSGRKVATASDAKFLYIWNVKREQDLSGHFASRR